MAMGRGRTPSVRQLRVGEEIRHCLSAILNRGDLHDPDLRDVSITVSEVRVSPDLRNATVFVMPLGVGADLARDRARDRAAIDALGRAASYLRGRVGREIRLKYLPRLFFQRDTSYDAAARVGGILRSPDVAKDLAGDPETDNRDPRNRDASEG